MPIARALALLTIPAEHWLEPPKHEYYQRILEYFEKKVTVSLARGPLVRMTIGKTTPRIDVSELDTQRRSADDIVSHVLRRSDQKLAVDPAILAVSEGSPENRLRHLVQSAAIYKRDTGIDGLYLGFPFLVARDGRSTTKPRIAPVLLWPVSVDVVTGVRGDVTIAFDREREDVRINPALEGIVGIEEMARWREAVDEAEHLERAVSQSDDPLMLLWPQMRPLCPGRLNCYAALIAPSRKHLPPYSLTRSRYTFCSASQRKLTFDTTMAECLAASPDRSPNVSTADGNRAQNSSSMPHL